MRISDWSSDVCSSDLDLLIVNTDGTLAERSGNGLTIFSQALKEQGLMPSDGECVLQVHHDKREGVSPLQTAVRVAEFEGLSGFWLDLGKPRFGPSAVAAQDEIGRAHV